jgi:hypothetical protein
VYFPHAVNWIDTVIVWVPCVTIAAIMPASNRGAVVQLAL